MKTPAPTSAEPLMEFEPIGHAPRARRSPRHDAAPEAALRAPDGVPHTLAEFRGQNVVLHVFDADRKTAAREAEALQRHLDEFAALNAQVVGIAPAGPRAQARFARQNGIRFLMLSDKAKQVIGPLALHGNETVIIDADGRVDKVYRSNGRAERDTDRVLRHLRAVERSEQWAATGRPPA